MLNIADGAYNKYLSLDSAATELTMLGDCQIPANEDDRIYEKLTVFKYYCLIYIYIYIYIYITGSLSYIYIYIYIMQCCSLYLINGRSSLSQNKAGYTMKHGAYEVLEYFPMHIYAFIFY